MMPTSPPKSERGAEAGFTLVEMLIVLAIVGLVTALVAPRLPMASTAVQRQAEVAGIRQAISAARAQAMNDGAPTPLSLVQPRSGAENVEVEASDGSHVLIFYGDGSSTGARILLRKRPLLDVDWLSGRMRDAR